MANHQQTWDLVPRELVGQAWLLGGIPDKAHFYKELQLIYTPQQPPE
jgi:hypothetical protein